VGALTMIRSNVKPKSRLQQLVARGVDLLARKRHLASLRRCNGEHFVTLARREANMSEERLAKLSAKVDATDGADGAREFTRDLRKAFAETQGWTRPPLAGQMGKVIRAYGGDHLAGQLTLLKCTVAELVCVAAQRAAEWKPSAFGKVNDHFQWSAAVDHTDAELKEVCDAMQKCWGAADVKIIYGNDGDRREGKGRYEFIAYPGHFAVGDFWPIDLLSAKLAERRVARRDGSEEKPAKKTGRTRGKGKAQTTKPKDDGPTTQHVARSEASRGWQ